jgi:hypothetical protein
MRAQSICEVRACFPDHTRQRNKIEPFLKEESAKSIDLLCEAESVEESAFSLYVQHV